MLNYFQQTKQRGSSTKKAKSKIPSASTHIEPPRSKVRRFESPFPTDRSQTLSSTAFEKSQRVNLSPSYFTSPVYTVSKERSARPVSCIVCDLPPSAGVMKRVVRHGSARRLWAHVACVAYRPEDGAVVVDEWEDISGVGVYVDRLGDKKRPR
eukprot:459280_1